MTDEELAAAADTLQNMQWRNKAINDTFQPGSTFKILTLAMALEENKVKMSDTFNCPGYVVIEGAKINCSKRAPGHGHQDLITAFAIPATLRSSTSDCASATRRFTIT